ncbi:MAG: hypothetical protein HYX78_15900, partial [Armatimonadetes bacterium]|nr:hypothetical protein [Armatimonadota bacterium]
MARILACVSAALFVCGRACALEPVYIDSGGAGSAIEKLAQSELKSYFARMFFNPVRGPRAGRKPHVIIGTPDSNPLIKRAIGSKKISLPTGKNSDQGHIIKTVGKAIYVAGHTGHGVLYGVYDLLEKYGVYFQISGERMPARSWFKVKPIDVSVSPVFKYRGIFPWDNFLDGMSGYNFEHYQELIDRAA